MTRSDLTADRLRELLHYDPATGLFTWRVGRHAVPAGSRAGSAHKGKGYVNIRVDLRLYRAHRLAWLYANNEWPADEIDHINGDKVDNRLANLRVVDRATNAANMHRARNASGLLGVCQRGATRWEAQRGGEYLGSFHSAEAAHAAYRAARARIGV